MMIKKNDKIFLAGHNGMIGSAILKKLTKDGFKRIITVNKKLDLRNQSEVYNFIKAKNLSNCYCCCKSRGNTFK